ncbi:MAG: RNA-binding family protein [Amphiamblys sp. WSBS2006]|nr:MAG: RNA-binding family protein [Amphiamblys sp. WSBS2006]
MAGEMDMALDDVIKTRKRQIPRKPPGPRRPPSYPPRTELRSRPQPVQTRIIVGNLHPSAFEEDLRNIFNEFGIVRRAVILTDREKRPIGVAEIDFVRPENAAQAMRRCNGMIVFGQKIRIETPVVRTPWKARQVARPAARPVARPQERPYERRNPPRRDHQRPQKDRSYRPPRGGQPKREGTINAEQLDKDLDVYMG